MLIRKEIVKKKLQMEIDLLKKKNCELEVHIENIKQQTPKRSNNQDKKKKKNEIQFSLKPITEAQKLD